MYRPLAARPDEPSNPIHGLVLTSQDLVLQAQAAISSWHWISGSVNLELDNSVLIAQASYITLDSIDLELTDDLFHFYLTQIAANEDLQMNVNQNFTEQLLPYEVVETIDPGDAVGRLDSLEQELAVSTTNPAFYKEFAYTGEDLTGYTIYTNSSKTTELFDVTFTFDTGLLTEKVVTRASDGQVLTITYGYTGDLLTSQTRVIT